MNAPDAHADGPPAGAARLVLRKGDHISILGNTTAERMQPTLPGVEETATPSSGIVESVDPVTATVDPSGMV